MSSIILTFCCPKRNSPLFGTPPLLSYRKNTGEVNTLIEKLMELFMQLNDEEKDEVIEYIKTLPLNYGECKRKE